MKTCAFLLLLSLAVPSSWATMIRFSELGSSSAIDVDGVHLDGVRFAFGPGQGTFNQEIGTTGTAVLAVDPVLEGPTTGILTLHFDTPTQYLGFDLMLLSIATIDDSSAGLNGGPAYTVLLSNGVTVNRGATPQPGGLYAEDHFSYSGNPITSATISFFNGYDAYSMQVAEFGLDNLSFGENSGLDAPEPLPFILIGAGLLLMTGLKRL